VTHVAVSQSAAGSLSLASIFGTSAEKLAKYAYICFAMAVSPHVTTGGTVERILMTLGVSGILPKNCQCMSVTCAVREDLHPFVVASRLSV
jgi:hypothetical protein